MITIFVSSRVTDAVFTNKNTPEGHDCDQLIWQGNRKNPYKKLHRGATMIHGAEDHHESSPAITVITRASLWF